MKEPSLKKLIIIPAYNEAANIARTIREVREAAPDYDFVVINDCSEDGTAEICRENGAMLIDLGVHLGIGGTVQTGYQYALRNGYDCAVQIDGDGQHDPACLKSMYDALIRENAEMVIGSRFAPVPNGPKRGLYAGSGTDEEKTDNRGADEREPDYRPTVFRKWGIRYFSVLIRFLTGQKITDPTSGLRMTGMELIRVFAQDYPVDYPEPESLVRILKEKRKVIEVPVRMRRRTAGRSSIRMKDSVYYMIKVTLAVILERMRAD